ncbi:DUF4873 domain-containing protein [Streptomyces thermolineatus]|uniref:DUF4873 domain-containing protein n=1 Tax=Streptomyces thermolineatus TaxID=44033 RepID=UPI00384FB8E9
MSTYKGLATFLVDGVGNATEAELQASASGDGRSWSGWIEASPDIFWKAYRGEELRLRMPDGREGRVVVSDVDPTGFLKVTGGGPAPF